MFRVLCVLLCVQAIFSLWPVLVKRAIDDGSSALLLASTRDALASLLLWLGVWLESGRPNVVHVLLFVFTTPVKLWHLEVHERSLFLLLGVCSALNSVGYVIALQYVTPFNSALLHPTIPVFAAALAAMWGVERLTPRKILGTCICIAGSVVVVVSQADLRLTASLAGNILLVVQSFAMAALLVGQKFVPSRHTSLKTTAIYYTLGAVLSLPVSLTVMESRGGGGVSLTTLGPVAWGVVVFGAVFVVSFNYAALTWANKKSSPSIPATSMMLQPPLTFLLGYLLGERPQAGGWEIGGGAVIIIGLIMTTLTERSEAEGWGHDVDALLADGKGTYTGVNGESELDDIDIGSGAGGQVDGWNGVSNGGSYAHTKGAYGGVGVVPTARPRRSASPVGAEDGVYLLKTEGGGGYM